MIGEFAAPLRKAGLGVTSSICISCLRVPKHITPSCPLLPTYLSLSALAQSSSETPLTWFRYSLNFCDDLRASRMC